MMTKAQLSNMVREQLNEIVSGINDALKNQDSLKALEPTLKRNGKGGKVPHWYNELASKGTLPNLDGKTIGSVIEMLLVGVLESHTFRSLEIPQLRVNPARGVDLPDLDLGVKSPSTNFCTSEPFFSAYERLIGSEYDALVLLTDYQIAKKSPPLKLQIIKWRYATKTQLADKGLCRIALKHRKRLLQAGEARAKRVFRFLSYVNQSDWLGRRLVGLVDQMDNDDNVRQLIKKATLDFNQTNKRREKKSKTILPESALAALSDILPTSPLSLGITDAAENWVVENFNDAARAPNDNEWNRLAHGPLDGKIGMSPALQWRYNFGQLFGLSEEESRAVECDDVD